MIERNKKYDGLLENDTRYFIITGGRGSGKSFEVGTFATILSFFPNHKILFTRQTMTSAHLSIIPEFQEKIDLIKANHLFDINKSDIVQKQTKSEIIFKGLKTSSGDQTANLKSLQGVTTWILDEAEELTDEVVFDKINLSIREKGIQNRVILILNPATKEHWIYKRFFESVGVKDGFNGVKDNVTYIHTTYLDNLQNLSESFIDEIEKIKETNPKKYNHVILGGWLEKAEGVVFTNWKFGTFNPDNLQTSFGQDYGYSIDPTTLVEVAIDKTKKIIYCKEHLYKVKLTTSEIAQINNSITSQKLIVGDSAEQRLIDELTKQGNRIIGAKKGPGSIEAGVSLMQDYELIIEGVNLAKELNNYVYLDKGAKLYIDSFNHCFIGETLITTIKGEKQIKDIQINDLVLTSSGFKQVLKVFNNGIKKVNKYSMKFDTFSLSLIGTENHKIKTVSGWKKLRQISKNDTLYLDKNLTGKNLNYTKEKNISQEVAKECILRYGNTIKEKYQKVTKCITLTEILSIMKYQILIYFTQSYINVLNLKKDLRIILNLLKNFMIKVLKQLKSGTDQKRVGNGIVNTEKKCGLIDNIKQKNVRNAVKNMKQDTLENHCTAIITAKLKQIDVKELPEQMVYDLMVEDCHEYFANGVLVHNCIDAIRYNVQYNLSGSFNIDIR